MINEKMYALGAKRSEIRELFEYGLKRKAAIGVENVYDFSLGNPNVPAPQEVTDGLYSLLDEIPAEKLHAYTSAQGDAAVREAIINYINKEHGVDYSKDSLYMSMGAAAALSASLGAVVSPGEEVILLAPYFPEYKVFVEAAGGVVVEVMCDPVSFKPDVDAIGAAITDKTAAIIVNSPNNPTGAVYGKESITALSDVLRAAEEKYEKPIYIIADEPYRELVWGDAAVPFIPKYYNDTIVCYSYSKSISLPGERIGYVLVPPTVTEAGRVYAAVCGCGRSLGYVCAPSMLQKLVPYCLGKTSDLTVYDRNRKILLEELSSYGFTLVKPEGAFYLFMRSPIESAKEFCEAAKKHEILIVPSESFGCPGYVRISYCVSTEEITRALPAFKNLAKDFGLC